MKPTNQIPQAVAEGRAELVKFVAEQRCPEEYRAAFCHLMEILLTDAETIQTECELSTEEQTEIKFRLNILWFIIQEPNIDLYELGDLAEDLSPLMPNLRGFAERIKTLADLQQK